MIKKLNLLIMMLILAEFFYSCSKKPKQCTFDNPLTDLPWLKGKIDEFNLLAQKNQSLSIAVYQCKYGNEETGFLVDEGNKKPFYKCNGEIVCIMSGLAGETCPELNIVSAELIWEINYPTEDYPIEIPFTEYSLAGTSCRWKDIGNYRNIFFPYEITIINNDKELEKYIVCTDGRYPTVDFFKYSFVCVSGWTPSAPADVIEIRLQRISANEYSLYLKVRGGLLGTTGPWNISIIVPKLLQSATITFNVQQINY